MHTSKHIMHSLDVHWIFTGYSFDVHSVFIGCSLCSLQNFTPGPGTHKIQYFRMDTKIFFSHESDHPHPT